jgi:hypothetical protein
VGLLVGGYFSLRRVSIAAALGDGDGGSGNRADDELLVSSPFVDDEAVKA